MIKNQNDSMNSHSWKRTMRGKWDLGICSSKIDIFQLSKIITVFLSTQGLRLINGKSQQLLDSVFIDMPDLLTDTADSSSLAFLFLSAFIVRFRRYCVEHSIFVHWLWLTRSLTIGFMVSLLLECLVSHIYSPSQRQKPKKRRIMRISNAISKYHNWEFSLCRIGITRHFFSMTKRRYKRRRFAVWIAKSMKMKSQ
jgi:hypothetical protein